MVFSKCQSLPAQDHQIDESLDRHFNSIGDLQVTQYRNGALSSRIDAEVQLVFAARYWDVFFVQQGQKAAMVRCTPAHSEMLCNHQVGARLRIRGSTEARSMHIKIDSVEVIDPDAKLVARPAGNLSEEGHAPINGLATLSGRTEEVFIGPGRSAVFMWVGYIPAELDIVEQLSANEALPLISRTLTAEGALCRNFDALDAIYLVRIMRRTQLASQHGALVGLGADSREIDLSHLNVYTGVVTFSDQRSKLLVSMQDGSHVVWSRFARRVAPGEKIIFYELKDRSDSNADGSISSCAIVSQAIQSLNAGVEMSVDEVFRSSSLPQRITLRGRVKHVQLNNGECELDLISSNRSFRAIIPSDLLKLSSPGYRPDDEILLTGSPLVQQNDNHEQIEEPIVLTIYAASESDLQFIAAPLRVPPSRMALALFLMLAVLGSALAYNRHLRKQVAARTEKLEEVASQFQQAFGAVREVVLVNDKEQKISGVTQNIQSFFGFTPSPRQDIRSILRSIECQVVQTDEFQDFCNLALSERRVPTTATITLHSPDRTASLFSCAIIDANNHYVGNLWMVEDITEKLRLEHELMQAKKMEIVGQMSSGVAHDFNNLLTMIRSNLTMVRIASQSQRNFDKYLTSAESAISRGAELIRYLLDFSRQSQLSFETIDANQYLVKLYNFLREAIEDSIEMELQVCDVPTYVNVDPARLEHVLINICFNARDAIRPGGGKILLKAFQTNDGPFESSLVLSISDDGCGMSQEVRAKIFEPFFTTKATGNGTGLGLAMASGIVEQFGGFIECDSTVDVGTAFRIVLPMVAPPNRDDVVVSGVEQSNDQSMRILVVDDEALVRESCSAILESLGHSVVTAENGQHALDILYADDRFDAALLDLSMPVMSGRDAYQEISRMLPHLPIAICSAHALDGKHGLHHDAPLTIVRKPYCVSDLEAGLRSLQQTKVAVAVS